MRLLKNNGIDSKFSFYYRDTETQEKETRVSFLKRPFDILLSLFGLVISFPLWVIVAAAIWLEDGRPILYRQKRLGKKGKEFQLLKFRSMIKNAEQQTGPVWASKDDHRITKVGRILRKTALDELPQLYNILRGNMSFVGPRAERPELADEIGREVPGFNYRLSVRPGLTGVAQVYAEYNVPPKNKLRYDKLYIKNQSFLLDLKLILVSFWITFTFKWADAEKRIDRLIGQIMLEAGVITEKQLKEALECQKTWGGKIGENLIRKGYASESELNHFLNVQVTLSGRGNGIHKKRIDFINENGQVQGNGSGRGNGIGIHKKRIDRLIGQIMLEAGVITEKQLKEALECQKTWGGKIGENLIRKGYASESELNYFLDEQLSIRTKRYKSL